MAEEIRIIIITPDGQQTSCWTLEGKNLWELIASNGMDPGGSCGGKGTCGKCKVRIAGQVNDISDTERMQLLPEEIKAGTRIACNCTVKGPLTVYLDYANNLPSKKGMLLKLHPQNIKPQVQYRTILIPGMEKTHPIPLHERLSNALSPCRLDITVDNLNQLAMLDRAGRPALELYALIFNENSVKYIGRHKEKAYGVAIDLGTTSLFAALLDLENSETAALANKSNMQRIYGADLISRVNYCLENPEGLEVLQRILINNLNMMLEEMLQQVKASAQNIYRLTVVGNPVMLHLLMGLNPSGFASAPYAGLFTGEIAYPAMELGLNVNPHAEILLLPQVGGFVGADTIACLLTLPDRHSGCFCLVDIGTNGEVILSRQGKMWAASAAAGPAFEGGNLSNGMRAGSGVIDKVRLNDDSKLEFNVLGDGPAKGICGSATIDLVACLLKASGIDANGTINPENASSITIETEGNGAQIKLLEENETFNAAPMIFKQEDIRQVQLAKGAIRTAMDILLKEAGLVYADLDRIYLAGAFGNFLDPENSILIGMLPPVKLDRIKNIGNAAGQGAIHALLSAAKEKEARQMRGQISYIELATHPNFQEMFLKNLNFSPALLHKKEN